MEIHEVLTALGTSQQIGLTDAEATERLVKHGFNELTKEEKFLRSAFLLISSMNVLLWSW